MIETGESFSVNMVGGDTSQLTLLPSADHTVHTGAYECVAVTGSNEITAEFNITVQCKHSFSLTVCVMVSIPSPYCERV